MKHHLNASLPRSWRALPATDDTPYLSFLNIPVLAGCLGAWVVVLFVAAVVAELF